MVPLEPGKPTLRSALFFDYDTGECRFGQRGVDDYLSGAHGRLMMSLKSILGSSLMQEDTLINHKRVPFTDILGCLLRYIKQQAEQFVGHELSQVVLGRPVHFHDEDPKKDRLAQDTLEKVAKAQGFKTVLFQYEPIAAALTYEQNITQEQLALIVDLGGGTSDFSVIRLGTHSPARDRREDVLANHGIHIGGTDFDTRFNLKRVMPQLGLGGEMQGLNGLIPIPSSYYYDLTAWHTLHALYVPQAKRHIRSIRNMALEPRPIERLIKVIDHQEGHRILNEVERGKCILSQVGNVDLDLRFIEQDFILSASRTLFEEMIKDKVEQLIQTLLDTIVDAGIKKQSIDSVFFTGGSTQIPIIQRMIIEQLPTAKIVQGDVYSSVGKGLIIEAERQFGGGDC
jgi:hypothetical chaperone protein